MKITQMKIKYYLLPILVIAISLGACKNDDDDGIIDGIEEEDRQERQDKDKVILLEYLETHYYNSEFFVGNSNPSIDDLVITELADGESLPDNHTFLIDAVETKTSLYLDVIYEYHFLKINQGGGDTPHFVDKIRLNYSGNLLDGEVFDSSVTPIDFDLVSLIPGWSRVIPEFNVAGSFVENGDGTVSYTDPGVGAMFLPSGLAYFSGGSNGILPYASIAFKFELFQTEVSDHDGDGIPSYLEDLNDNLNMSDDDTDENTVPNFADLDDDGDLVLTIDELFPTIYTVDTNQGDLEPILGAKEFEISRSEEAGVITINTVKVMDSNSDGLDDYLDINITINYNEEG